jgi:integrase
VCGVRGRFQLRRGRGNSALVCECGHGKAESPEIVLRWRGQTYRLTHDQQGRRLRTAREAETAQAMITDQIARGCFFPEHWSKASKLLWQHYWTDYLTRQERRVSRARMQGLRSYGRHLVWFNGRNLREIRTADVETYATLPCLELALAPSTRRDILGTLNHLFGEAVRREEIERAPKVPGISVPQQPIPWLMPEQQDLVFAHIPSEHQPIFNFMRLYGCRPGEACALMWDAVDTEQGVLYFRRTLSARRLAETTKTRKARALPIFDAFAEMLASLPRGIGAVPVFRNPRALTAERLYNITYLDQVWNRAVAAAGLPSIKLKNGLRHSAGMFRMNMEGWHDTTVAMLLGHTDTRTTRKFYAQPQVPLLKRLVDGDKVVNRLSIAGLPATNGQDQDNTK